MEEFELLAAPAKYVTLNHRMEKVKITPRTIPLFPKKQKQNKAVHALYQPDNLHKKNYCCT